VKRIRYLGLAAVMALALSASIGAASAGAASGFVADEYPATYEGDPSGPANSWLEWNGYKCGLSLDLSGEAGGPAPSTVLSAANGECETGGHSPGTVDMNDCKLIFHPGTVVSGKAGGTFDIGPAGCGPVTIDWGVGCEGLLYPKSGLAATYENVGGASIEVHAQATGLTLQTKGNTCVKGTHEAEFNATWEITAENQSEEAVDVQVASIPGVYVAGAGADQPAHEPRIEADTYPKLIGGEGLDTFTTNLGSFKCDNTGLASELLGATSELDLEATYSYCYTSTGKPAEVDMNSCHYELGVQNAGPPYSGTWGIACDQPGDAIEFKAYWFGTPASYAYLTCTMKVGPQQGLEGVDLANVSGPLETGIAVDAEVTGVDYETSGLCVEKPEARTDGVLAGETALLSMFE